MASGRGRSAAGDVIGPVCARKLIGQPSGPFRRQRLVLATVFRPFAFNAHPNLAAFITQHVMQPGYDYANVFEWGLDVVLDGIQAEQA